ncbi:MAG: ABC transporter permease [Candidatus Limnocylindria bacterium]
MTAATPPVLVARRPYRLQPERLRELSLIAVIVVSIFVFNFLIEDYLSERFLNRISTGVTITAILAAAQLVVILSRNIDLSLGSIVGITAYMTGEFVSANPGILPVLAIGLAVVLGAALGTVNGVLVAYGRVPSIIVTLGTLALYRSWLIEYGGARTITTDTLPDWIVSLPQVSLVSLGELDLRLVFATVLVLVVVLQLALSRLRWGRQLYATGSNPEAAKQAGLPVQRRVLGAFILSGALAGLAGFIFLSRFGTVNATAGSGLELQAVAAAVVGGASTMGGSGTVLGVFLGAILIDLLTQSIPRVPGVSEFWRDGILGALILIGVTADFRLRERLKRQWGSTRRPPAAPVPGLAGVDG